MSAPLHNLQSQISELGDAYTECDDPIERELIGAQIDALEPVKDDKLERCIHYRHNLDQQARLEVALANEAYAIYKDYKAKADRAERKRRRWDSYIQIALEKDNRDKFEKGTAKARLQAMRAKWRPLDDENPPREFCFPPKFSPKLASDWSKDHNGLTPNGCRNVNKGKKELRFP